MKIKDSLSQLLRGLETANISKNPLELLDRTVSLTYLGLF